MPSKGGARYNIVVLCFVQESELHIAMVWHSKITYCIVELGYGNDWIARAWYRLGR